MMSHECHNVSNRLQVVWSTYVIAKTNKTRKIQVAGPLLGETTDERYIPLTNGLVMPKLLPCNELDCWRICTNYVNKGPILKHGQGSKATMSVMRTGVRIQAGATILGSMVSH